MDARDLLVDTFGRSRELYAAIPADLDTGDCLRRLGQAAYVKGLPHVAA